MKRLVCVLSALSCALVLAVSAMAQSANVSGDWDVTINSPQGPRTGKVSFGQKGGDKVDVTGAWNVTVETEAGSGNPSFTFKQEDEKLTGRYKGTFGEADLTGTVKGDKIEFSFKVSGQIEGTITYTGTTDGKTMKGKVNLAGLGEGTFSGKKQ